MNEAENDRISIEEILKEMSPLGQALFDAAQLRVVVRLQATEIKSLHEQIGKLRFPDDSTEEPVSA